jgi:WD40 repeat protein
MWQLATREGFEIELDAPVVSVAITPDGRYVGVRECDARNGAVRAWDLLGPGPDKLLLQVGDVRLGRGPFPLAEAWKREGRLLAFSPDGGTLVTGSVGGQKDAAGLTAWPVGDLPQRFAAPAERWGDVHAMAFSSTGLLATAVRLDPLDRNGPDLYLWDPDADAMIARTRAHANMISSLAFSADGTRLATCAYKGPIKFWFPHREATSLENKRIAPEKNVKATGLAFAPIGNLLATVAENQLTIWDSDLWQPVQSATLEESTVGVSDIELFSVAYSPDGRLIAVAGGSGPRGYVVIWRTEPAENSQPIAILKGHRGPVTAVAFSALQPILVSGSTDGTIRLWDISSIE